MTSTVQDSEKKGSNATTINTRTAVTARPRSLTHEVIALRAHSLYEQSGFQSGREVEFWLEAERQLREDLDV
jgi:DUF2934 family protein